MTPLTRRHVVRTSAEWRRPARGRHRQEVFEDLHVKSRGRFTLGMPLHAEAEPIFVDRLVGLDHAVGTGRRDLERRRDLVDAHVVLAVDANFTGTINRVDARAGNNFDDVPQRRLDRIAVMQRPLEVFGNVLMQRSAAAPRSRFACPSRSPEWASAFRRPCCRGGDRSLHGEQASRACWDVDRDPCAPGRGRDCSRRARCRRTS